MIDAAATLLLLLVVYPAVGIASAVTATFCFMEVRSRLARRRGGLTR